MTATGKTDINYGPATGTRTIDGDVTITGDARGNINLRNLQIKGNLTVNTPNATVNNEATVDGTITILDVAVGTWNENADGNKIVVNDKTGITLNIGAGKTVNSLTLNQQTTVAIGEGAKVSKPIAVNANSTIISEESVSAIIKENVDVTLKTEKEDEEGTIIKGTGLDKEVDLKAEAVAAAVAAAEKAIKELPLLKDIRISHKDTVLKAQALVDKVKALDSNAKVEGEELISGLLEKIKYLENEKDGDIS